MVFYVLFCFYFHNIYLVVTYKRTPAAERSRKRSGDIIMTSFTLNTRPNSMYKTSNTFKPATTSNKSSVGSRKRKIDMIDGLGEYNS